MQIELDCVISAMDKTLLTDHISFSARAFSTKCTFFKLVSGVSKVPVSSFTFFMRNLNKEGIWLLI